MKLRCPNCGFTGEVKGADAFFESRGQWPGGHWPIRKCRSCGAGIIVKPGIGRARGKLIEPGLWAEMEAYFEQKIAGFRRDDVETSTAEAAANGHPGDDGPTPSELERAS